ncbi:MAG: hypothetical protein R2725_12315 [Solirubrobacterales bacterium]
MAESLKARVRAILYEEAPGPRKLAWDRLTDLPTTRPLNEMEATSRLWGYAFGLAYGIARAESKAPDARVAKRAYDVALSLLETRRSTTWTGSGWSRR